MFGQSRSIYDEVKVMTEKNDPWYGDVDEGSMIDHDGVDEVRKSVKNKILLHGGFNRERMKLTVVEKVRFLRDSIWIIQIF